MFSKIEKTSKLESKHSFKFRTNILPATIFSILIFFRVLNQCLLKQEKKLDQLDLN